MKKYIQSSTFEFPEFIKIAFSDRSWPIYRKQYEHDGGGCYYAMIRSKDRQFAYPFDQFVSLYPDGHLTYLGFRGAECDWDTTWKPCDDKEIWDPE